MKLTRRELVDDVLDLIGESGDPGARASANRMVNRAMETLWLRHPWRQFWMPTPYTFLTVAGQRAYPLPEYFGRVGTKQGKIRNLTTGAVLDPVSAEYLETVAPSVGSAADMGGMPSVYTIGGTVGVAAQPAALDAVTVVSDDGADTDILVSLEGLDLTGRWVGYQATLNGTTPVNCGSWSLLVTFGKAYPPTTEPTTASTSSRGNVTLAGTVTGTLQMLLPSEPSVEHPQIVLAPTPNASGQMIAVPVLRALGRLLYEGDTIPDFWGPALHEEVLIQWQVLNGEMRTGAEADRPAFRDLVAFDNTGHLAVPDRKRGWTG